MNNSPVSFFTDSMTKTSEIQNPVSVNNNSNQNENISFEKVLTSSIERENKLIEENKRNKIKDDADKISDEEKEKRNPVKNTIREKLENNTRTNSTQNTNRSEPANIHTGLKKINISDICESENSGEKNKLKSLEKNINEIMSILNLILQKLDKSGVDSSSSNSLSIDSNNLNKLKTSIKDIFDKLKNYVSQDVLKKALNDFEKIMENPALKAFIEQAKNNEQTQGTPLLKMLLELPGLIDKVKNAIPALEVQMKSLPQQIMKDIKNGEIETGYKDLRLIQGRHRIHETESRHRNNSENGNNSFNHQNNNRNFDNVSRPQLNQNINSLNQVNNFENTVRNFNVNETLENRNPQPVFSAREPFIPQKDILNQLTRSVRYAVDGNKKELTMNIQPKELGRIDVKLSMENGHVSARFAVENERVHSLLIENKNDLVRQLENAGLRVDNVNIELQSRNGSSNSSQRHFENTEIDDFGFVHSSKRTNGNSVDDNNDQIINNYMEIAMLPEWLASEVNLTV